MNIINEILEKMNILVPTKKFIGKLLETILSMGGRVNFRNMSRYTNYNEKTFSRNMDKEFDYVKFNINAINRIVKPSRRYAISYDPFFIKKSGKHTYGKEKFWNGSEGKSEEGLEGNGFALIDVDCKTAYPVGIKQTPPKEEIKELIGKPEATRMDFYVRCADEHLKKIKSAELKVAVKHAIFDAYFANEKFVEMILENDYQVVSKLRCDANLRHINKEKIVGPGRPKKYAEKVNVKDVKSFNFVCNLKKNVDLYEGTFYSINLKRIVKIACLVFTRNKKQSMVLLFSTDLNLSAQDIHAFYSSRFQIEFAFRDGKQFVGLTECQARSKTKIHNHLNSSLSALLIAKIQTAEIHPHNNARIPFSMESIKRKNYNEMLIKLIISKLGFHESLIKLNPEIKKIVERGVIRC